MLVDVLNNITYNNVIMVIIIANNVVPNVKNVIQMECVKSVY